MAVPNSHRRWPLAVMIGPNPLAKGGVASVVAMLAEAGLFEGGEIAFIASHVDGSRSAKLRVAIAALLRYFVLLVRGRAAVLHVHVSSHASFWRKSLFMILARLFGRRVVFHLHGGGFAAFYDSLSRPSRALACRVIGLSTTVLCLSTSMGAWLRTLLPHHSPMWWPNPVPEAYFGDAAEPQQDTSAELLYLGALLPAKGVATLLEAFAVLRRHDGRALLRVAGSGPDEVRLRALASAAGLEGAVEFMGWVQGAQKIALLRRARLLVLPSMLEQQPMVLLEAMALGTPILATRVGGIPDLFVEGREGLLVEPDQPTALADALCRAWDDAALRRELAVAARERAARWHRAPAVSGRLRLLYRGLAGDTAESKSKAMGEE